MRGIIAFHGDRKKRGMRFPLRTPKIGWANGICKNCTTPFIKICPVQRFCGSATNKTGCSYLRLLERWKYFNKKYYNSKAKSIRNKRYREKQKQSPLKE